MLDCNALVIVSEGQGMQAQLHVYAGTTESEAVIIPATSEWSIA
jgi:hypothetical protein